MTVLRVTHPIGRADYICEDCNTTIAKGARHVCIAQVVDDDGAGIWTFRAHEDCRAAGDAVCARTEDDDTERSPLWVRVQDYPGELVFVREKYPAVAARLIQEQDEREG